VRPKLISNDVNLENNTINRLDFNEKKGYHKRCLEPMDGLLYHYSMGQGFEVSNWNREAKCFH